MRGDISSQFLSGLLMAAPRAQGDVTIQIDGVLVSWPYLGMTVEMMRHFGAQAKIVSANEFHVRGENYGPTIFQIEPDASAASVMTVSLMSFMSTSMPRTGRPWTVIPVSPRTI